MHLFMASAGNTAEGARSAVSTIARAMANQPGTSGEGPSQAFCVRLSSTVLELLKAAKPKEQSMPQFLRECGVTVALQRLEDSQKSTDPVSETVLASS